MPISIHPPRAGRDFFSDHFSTSLLTFQSTRPVRGGTLGVRYVAQKTGISIHPPRAGRDLIQIGVGRAAYISIHPPRAGRDATWCSCCRICRTFQSTRPVRGGTHRYHIPTLMCEFQSTRPVRGGT